MRLPLFTKFIADAVNSQNVARVAGVGFYLFAQIFDVRIHAAIVAAVHFAMQPILKLRASKGLARVLGQ